MGRSDSYPIERCNLAYNSLIIGVSSEYFVLWTFALNLTFLENYSIIIIEKLEGEFI